MKTFNATLIGKIESESSKLVTLIEVENDFLTRYFAESDQDVLSNGNLYRAQEGAAITNISNSAFLSSQSVEIIFSQSSVGFAGIREEEVLRGSYDEAAVTILLADLDSPNDTSIFFKGAVTESEIDNMGFVKFTVEGSRARRRALADDVYSATCRNTLGDAICGFDINSTRVPFTIAASPAPTQFSFRTDTSSPDDFFTEGVCEFDDAENSGLFFDIRTYRLAGGRVALWTRAPYLIAAGDTGFLYQGCPKTLNACKNDFDNIINFRGEPYKPPAQTIRRRVV